jgi:TPP-dependent pyruvate/acetoin dehydrogenase alpha subunit
MFDPELYRDKAEVARWKERDPIATFIARAKADGAITDADVAAIEATVAQEITAAAAFAAASPVEPLADLHKDVRAEAPR